MSKRETIREVYERQIAEMGLTNRTLQAQVHRLQERALVMGELDQLTSRSNNNLLVENEQLRSELAKLREQKPVRWHVRGNYFHDGDAAILFASMNAVHGAKVEQLYAAPVPAPAVPNEIGLGKGEFVIWPVKIDGVHGLAFVKTDNPKAVGTCHAEPGHGQIELGSGDSVIYFGNAESAMVLAERLQYVATLLQSAEVTNAAADRLLEGGE